MILALVLVLSLASCGEYDGSSSVDTGDHTQRISENTSETASEHTAETPVHTHSYTSNVTAPTCTEKGYTTYTCDCGDTYQGDETAATGHTYNQGKCTRCNAADPDDSPADNDSDTVYITETGKKYHATEHCPGLANAKAVFESTLAQAKDKNLTPCARCH